MSAYYPSGCTESDIARRFGDCPTCAKCGRNVGEFVDLCGRCQEEKDQRDEDDGE